MPEVRLATPTDAQALALLAESTFRETYESCNTQENMDDYCQKNYSSSAQLKEILDPKMMTFISESNGEPIAFAQLRWSMTPECVAAVKPGELQRLYVKKNWFGKGIAPRLMEHCIKELSNKGADMIWLGVWEHNPRAIAFYKKVGFREAGAHNFQLGSEHQRDIIMVRPLSHFNQNQ